MNPPTASALISFLVASNLLAARCGSDLFFQDVAAFQRGGNLALKGSTCVIGGNPIAVFESTSELQRWQQTQLPAAGTVAFDGERIVRSLDGQVVVMERSAEGEWHDVVELAPDPAINKINNVSRAIAIDGATIVVGAPLQNDSPVGINFVSVYRRVNGLWTQEALLTTTNLIDGAPFGHAVAVSGETIVIGDLDRNAAHIYIRNGDTWEEQAKLTGADASGFGVSVALASNTVVVGASRERTGFGSHGAAYVFQRTGSIWTLETKLQNNELGLATFGSSVACDGDYVLVSSGQGTAVFKRALNGTRWCRETAIRGGDGVKSGNLIFTRDKVYAVAPIAPPQLVLFSEIISASETVRALAGQLETTSGLPEKRKRRLSSQLNAAARAFDQGRANRAVSRLRGFERRIRLVGPRYFATGTTAYFIQRAESIVARLERPGG